MSTPPSLDLPAGVHATRVTTSAAELAALVAVPQAGPGVRGSAVLVPGFTGSKEDFIAVLEPLRTVGWQVLALDLRGQHESTHAGDGDYDVQSLADDVVQAADTLPAGPVHLLGHSFGGLVARSAVIRAPQRFASLTLLCTGPAAIQEPSAGRLRLLLQALGSLDLPTIWGVMRQLDAENGVAVPPAPVEEFMRRRFVANDVVHLRRLAEQLLDEPDRVAELADAIRVADLPVLVAHGVGDDAWAHDAQREMAGRLSAGYEVIDHAAHSPAAEAPRATATTLDTLWSTVHR